MIYKSIIQDIASADKCASVAADASAAATAVHYVGRAMLFVGVEEIEEPAAVAAAPSIALELKRVGAVPHAAGFRNGCWLSCGVW